MLEGGYDVWKVRFVILVNFSGVEGLYFRFFYVDWKGIVFFRGGVILDIILIWVGYFYFIGEGIVIMEGKRDI